VKIAFDFDDVLVDFVQCWLDAVWAERGVSYDRRNIKVENWDMTAWANDVLGTEGMGWLEWLNGGSRINYWKQAATEPGMLEVLHRLHRQGHVLELVTNKPPWARQVVWAWLHRTDAPFTEVQILDTFGKEQASTASLLVDDRPDTIRKWEKTGRTGILYARSQNETDRNFPYVAYTPEDICWIIDTLEARRAQLVSSDSR